MRHGKFGDAYCHTASEVLRCCCDNADAYYVPESSIEPPEGEWQATAKVVDNIEGETACYIEAPTIDQVRAIIAEVGLEIA